MKLSARNVLNGTVVDVTRGATTSHVRIDIGGGVIVTASITNEAVDEPPRRLAEELAKRNLPAWRLAASRPGEVHVLE